MNENKVWGRPVDLPKWVVKLTNLITRYWQHHGPCESINFKCTLTQEGNFWMVHAAPAYQEVFGGEQDGEQVWTGFIFEAGEFSRESGLWIQDFAVASHCSACESYPKIMFKGKFRGHNVMVYIMLEPDKNTSCVEILDTIKQEIRYKDNE